MLPQKYVLKKSSVILEMICWKTIGRSPMVSPSPWPLDLIRHPTSPVTTLFCASRPVSGTASITVKSWGTTASVHGLWHQWTNAGFNFSSKVWFLRKETYFYGHLYNIHIWLVVAANPSEKSWSESQLGWWHCQHMESHKTCSKPPTS